MIAGRPKLITAEEFERFDPEWRYDLIEGELHTMPPMPGEEHGAITSDFSTELNLFVRDHGLGQCYAAETRFLIARDPDTAIGPDWAFITKERLPKKRNKGFSPLVPDIVLEVRSPSDKPAEVQKKINLWLSAGVQVVWEANPKREVLTVYRPGVSPVILTADSTLTCENILPGFALPLRRIWPD